MRGEEKVVYERLLAPWLLAFSNPRAALGSWPLADPKQRLHKWTVSKHKNSGFDVIWGQFDAIGTGFKVEFVGSNEITPLES
jgi:hypothetical protein